MQRRVRKADIKPDTWVKPDALDLCLECWKAWMGGDSDRDLGIQTMRATSAAGMDSAEMQQASDDRVGAATDAMIDSLSRLHIWAIYQVTSVASPWRFPNADLVVVAEEARQALAVKLKNNVCTAALF